MEKQENNLDVVENDKVIGCYMKNNVLFKRKTSRSLNVLFNQFIASYNDRLAKTFVLRKQQKMAVFAHDTISNHINQFGYYEKAQLDTVFGFLRNTLSQLSSRTALDIGANVGNHSLYFMDHFDRIYSFEPNPATFYLLNFNVSKFTNVTAFNFGLGERSENLVLNEYNSNIGASSIVRHSGADQANQVGIQIKRLDDLEIDLNGLCLIKIDVEGFEEFVIKGGKNTIKTHQPIILLEQDVKEFDDGTTASIELLKSIDYRFCWVESVNQKRHWLIKRLRTLAETFSGREYRVLSGKEIPTDTYAMLVAVPPRFHSELLN